MNNSNSIATVWNNVRFSKEIAPHEKYFFDQFVRIAKNSEKILEVGVGTGRMISILKKNGVTATFSAIDLTSRLKMSDIDFNVADAREIPYKNNTFDLVYSLGVVEHYPETFKSIQEHVRVVRPGGVVLVTTPHISPYTFLRLYRYVTKKEYQNGTFEVVRGRNIFLRKMNQDMVNSGLELIYSSAVGKWLKGYVNTNFFDQKLGPYLCVIGKKL